MSTKTVALGSWGFSTNLINKQAALSPGQISYRLKVAGTSRKDYRNGDSPMAKYLMRLIATNPEIRRAVSGILRRQLRGRGFEVPLDFPL